MVELKEKIRELEEKLKEEKNNKNRVDTIFTRINHYQKNLKETGSIFCSMGIMAVDHRIFDIFSDLEKFNDWDLLVDFLFKTKLDTNSEFIDFLKYNDDWYCIHTKKDLQLINQKGEHFFRSFTTNHKPSQEVLK